MGWYRVSCWSLKWQLFYSILSCWSPVHGQIRYSVPEELQPGAFVGNIAQDLGLEARELAARRFRIVSGPRKQYLDVNVDNGMLFVKEKIDREELCGASLACVLPLEGVVENPVNVYHVEVEIVDVNDNAPSFPKSQFRLEISELASPGARFALECAHDPDIGTNSLQTYDLLGDEYFSLNIDPLSGDGKLPVLVLEKPLDRETLRIHRLVLVARDGGVPERSGTAQVNIIVQDANDNAPVFSESVYRVSLSENVPKGTPVVKVNATDLDVGPNGEIVYSFGSHTSGRVRELFALNARTGEINVKGELDYEEYGVYEINVEAKDKGSNAIPAYCHVLVDVVDVNDNPPEVTLTSLFSPVNEDARPGTVVALISATDRDSGENGQVQCRIANSYYFRLDSSLKNYYRLLTQRPLDRENISQHDLTVVCKDNGSPSLSTNATVGVEVSDVNDNSPIFLQPLYTARVMENNVIGASMFSVTARDPDSHRNAQLSYSLRGGQVEGQSVSNYVSVNLASGDIFSRRSFDYEQLKSFQIQVEVQDSGEPPLSSNASVDIIILDQNDNSPVIVSPLPEFGSTVTETVSRLAEPGYLVAKVSATDADTGQNGRLFYQILQATDPGLFTISPDTGEIWTIRSVRDRDANKQRLVIVVKDNGSPSLSATMTIVLSIVGGDSETLSDGNKLSERPESVPPLSLYLVISLGAISSIFLVVLVILAVMVHRNRTGLAPRSCCSLAACCGLERRHSLNGIQKASRNLQIPPNYVEVFGGDPLSQSYRYGSCSTSGSTKEDFGYPKAHRNGTLRMEEPATMLNCEHFMKSIKSEVRRWIERSGGGKHTLGAGICG